MNIIRELSLPSLRMPLILTFLGMAAAIYPLSFLYGIELYFIHAAAWFAYRRHSYSAAFAVSLTGAASGIFLWGHTPLLALFPLEIMAVHALVLRFGFPLAGGALLYWSTLGLLLHGAGYFWVTNGEPKFWMLVLLFQAGSGLLNVVIGDIAADYIPRLRRLEMQTDRPVWRIQRIWFQLCVILLVTPLSIFLYQSGHFTYREVLASTAGQFESMAFHLNRNINAMSEQDLHDLKVHSTLQKAALHTLFANLTLQSDIKLTLVDEENRVIAANERSVQQLSGAYDWRSGGEIKPLPHGLQLWMPGDVPDYNTISRWEGGKFAASYTLERLPYKLIAALPIAPFQQSVFAMFIKSLILAFALILVSALLALWATRRFSHSLSELADFSTDLPRKIRTESLFAWKQSRIHEVSMLSNNIAEMSRELSRMFHDINESEEKLRILVDFDTLTGLANRHSFSIYLPSVIRGAQQGGGRAACLFIDLDRFKSINDTYGHEAGDTFLREFGARLGRFSSDGVKVFRLAGDEFVIVLSEPLPDDLKQWADGVQRMLAEGSVLLDGHHVPISFSAGLAVYPDHGPDADSLVRSADTAMYQAKVSGRGRVRMTADPDHPIEEGEAPP
ncbi:MULTISPECIES: GGDEF domain-containing protein [Paenibacillus]|uniref:GGDEF domain-containing protein n=1 Tax=Paenibacillus TaxID=44249 RepID=UPI0022B8AE21|nr:GGDEF domain-containing protein [Paenibacillus caseinilyticus]MCZ8521334.1 GGDEF domain-containing protein [Paenibacillus caseinilyticus]